MQHIKVPGLNAPAAQTSIITTTVVSIWSAYPSKDTPIATGMTDGLDWRYRSMPLKQLRQ